MLSKSGAGLIMRFTRNAVTSGEYYHLIDQL